MIRIFTITAPLAGQDPEAACTVLADAMDKLRRLYPPLVEATALADRDVLTLKLRVSARDQWACSAAARKIGTNMLLRLKIPADQGQLQLVRTAPPATTLTKEQGRSVVRHQDAPVQPLGAL